jgi:patched domain-containing protein
LGIGVDDAFLTLHAWFSTATKGLTPKHKIIFVIEEVGPSMTITTVTNVLTFAIGAALTPTIGHFININTIKIDLSKIELPPLLY